MFGINCRKLAAFLWTLLSWDQFHFVAWIVLLLMLHRLQVLSIREVSIGSVNNVSSYKSKDCLQSLALCLATHAHERLCWHTVLQRTHPAKYCLFVPSPNILALPLKETFLKYHVQDLVHSRSSCRTYLQLVERSLYVVKRQKNPTELFLILHWC